MPRPKKAGAPEPKRRSRNGCWPCKTRKVKCDETHPSCLNCQKQGDTCDYSIRLNWDGRGKKKSDDTASGFGQLDFTTVDPTSTAGNQKIDTSVRGNTSFSQLPTAAANFGVQSVPIKGLVHSIPPSLSHEPVYNEESSTTLSKNKPSSTDMSLIDPALKSPDEMATQAFPDTLYGNSGGQHQYAQSYERYHNSDLAQQPSLERLRHLEVDFNRSAPNSTESHSKDLRLGPISPSYSMFHGVGGDRTSQTSEEPHRERPLKRIRYNSAGELSPCGSEMPPPGGPTSGAQSPFSLNFQASSTNHAQSLTNSAGTPLTPAFAHSDHSYKAPPKPLPRPAPLSPDLRRLSVNSLLSGPPGIPHQSDCNSTPKSSSDGQDWSRYQDLYHDTTTWGIDRGIKDLDIGKNDDVNAISGSSPISVRDHLDLVLDEATLQKPVEFGFGTEVNDTAFSAGGYYDKPVSISIPRLLEPLPAKLLENPMNLLYFHHFLNHTAGALVPHNCSSNPFKLILPQMAVRDDNLLNLLLAYSASHRARLLRQPEPATRIALWVQGIFSNLRDALDDPSEIISNVNLATAIMLASLEIISPKAFGVAIPWQQHLDTARQMIAARGGPLRMKTASRGDKVASFLWSWFAYLDVLGSLSGGITNTPSSAWILDDEIDDDNDYSIDCILGFTSKCIRLLAKIAALARVCDQERAGSEAVDWSPSGDVSSRAEKLIVELNESRKHPAKPCTHMQSSGEAAYQWDSLEMAATNEAFHWAGLVHLHRRILGKKSSNPDVQNAVREIYGALYKVRKGSSAEACLLFPMFTAGCDSQETRQRADIVERIKSIERFGMTQIHQARTLMERVWEMGKPWETLVAGEFFG